MTETKTFTLAELADAIEKNGLEQITGWFFGYGKDIKINYLTTTNNLIKDRKITKACAIGQAVINLGIERPGNWTWDDPLTDSMVYRPALIQTVLADIIQYNDQGHTFKEVADFIRKQFANCLEYNIRATVFDYNPFL